MNNLPRMLWHCAYYDHPIDGIAEYKGEKVWFCEVDNKTSQSNNYINYDSDEEDNFPEVQYDIYSVSKETMKDMCESHAIFDRMVGKHTNHDPRRYSPYTKPFAESREYYIRNDIKKIHRPPVVFPEQKLGTFLWSDFIWYSAPKIKKQKISDDLKPKSQIETKPCNFSDNIQQL